MNGVWQYDSFVKCFDNGVNGNCWFSVFFEGVLWLCNVCHGCFYSNNVFPQFPEVTVAKIVHKISVKQVAGTVPYTIWIISHDNKRYISYP